ncbi:MULTISPECIES: NADPH-dependent FMN reductase [Jeotgalibacillus]|uniref:NADPH-dependent FMN reductase n=1 Tax=Jeotgalibacillus TaxID=157226 RepID=UPI001069DF81|nr:MULTISPECIES: NAD(P)H-dependent oxidoreductase [Jeotgalibacillus]TFE00121.1 NADPH-dependent oxidoreductase [Jeotgalibacillus sp. R-1-5s-1]
MKILALSGSLSGSKTYTIIREAAEYAKEKEDVEVELVNLSELTVQFCDGRDPSKYEGETAWLIRQFIEADSFIIGTPIYRGSLTGALKNVFDLIPNDALKGKVIGFVATGGTYHHYLAIEHQLNPLASYFRAHIVPGGVYAHNDHFTSGVLTDEDIHHRLRKLAHSVVTISQSLKDHQTALEQPVIPRQA